MSMLDSGMIFGSPLSPLRQNLFRGAMPNLLNPMMGAGGPAQPGPFTAAHQYGQARRRGSPTMGGPQAGAQAGPMNDSLLKASMIDAAGLDDDEKEKYKGLDVNGLREVLQLRQQTMAHRPKAAPRPVMSGDQQSAPQPSIGGPTPAGVGQGEMQILQGRGPNAMSAADLQAWQDRIQGALGKGETLNENSIGAGPWAQRQPGTQYRELTGRPGFTVGGMTVPQPQQLAGNPLVNAIQQHMQQFPGSQVLTMAQTPGFTPQQIIEQMNREAGEQRAVGRQDKMDQRETQREQHSDQRHQQDLMIRQLQHQQTIASQQGDDAQVQAIQQKIDGMMKLQAQQPQQPAGQMPDISKLQPGQQVVINGHVYEKE